jgi:hypothetical protein
MTKKITLFSLSGLLIASSLASVALAQSITYNPQHPRGEKPRRSQGSTSRGCSQNLNGVVKLLAPTSRVGLTVSARPTLLFRLTRESPVPAKLVIAAIDAKEALLEQQVSVSEPGIKRISLLPGIELEPDKEYAISLVLICNRVRFSENPVYQASIKRIIQSSALTEQLEKASSSEERGRIYAEEGIWYDAIAEVQNNPLLLRDLINQKDK